jgi:hypothetical protein
MHEEITHHSRGYPLELVGSVGVARAVDRIARPSQSGEDEDLSRTIAASR